MLRKLFILLGLIAATLVPAGIKAAAEPLPPAEPKPYILLISYGESLAQYVQSIIGPKFMVNVRKPSSMPTTDEVAGAACVLFNINVSSMFSTTLDLKNLSDIFPHYMENRNGRNQFRPISTIKALIMSSDRTKVTPVSNELEQIFGQNIFRLNLTKTDKIIPNAEFEKWLRQAIKPQARKMEMVKLDNDFPRMNDEEIATTLKDFIKRNDMDMVDLMLAHLQGKYELLPPKEGIESIKNIHSLIRDAMPTAAFGVAEEGLNDIKNALSGK